MLLTLIIRKSGSPLPNCAKTVKSLRHEDIQLENVIFIDKFSDIIYENIRSDWWIVLHDDEMIDYQLLEAITVAANWQQFDVFSFYKRDKNNNVSICPRMFRKEIRLEPDVLYPVMPVRMEVLLNGWVLSHD